MAILLPCKPIIICLLWMQPLPCLSAKMVWHSLCPEITLHMIFMISKPEYVSHSVSYILNLVGMAGLTVCVGSDWYQYPSSFFLPSPQYRVAWLDDGFEGLLPRPFDPSLGGTTSAPHYFNSKNKVSHDQFVSSALACQYVVWSLSSSFLVANILFDMWAFLVVNICTDLPAIGHGVLNCSWKMRMFVTSLWNLNLRGSTEHIGVAIRQSGRYELNQHVVWCEKVLLHISSKQSHFSNILNDWKLV